MMLPVSVTYRRDVPLASLTTLQVGGPAAQLVTVDNLADARSAIAQARAQALPVFVLGGGSNVVVADSGFPGLVLRYAALDWHAQRLDEDTLRIAVGAGLAWDACVARAVSEGLAGIECLSGIPGWVGAAPVQNIGAYGQQMGDCLESVDALDLRHPEADCVRFSRDDCGLGYRASHFKSAWVGRYLITRVTLRLRRGAHVPVAYAAELRRELDAAADGPATCLVGDVRDAVLRLRARKSMLLDSSDPNSRSVGSFFVNPVLPRADLDAMRLRCHDGAALPAHDQGDGSYKLSAAWLIEHSGFPRGFVAGKAGLSSRHALAIINRDQARAADIMALAERIQTGVQAHFGIMLQPEPVLVGMA